MDYRLLGVAAIVCGGVVAIIASLLALILHYREE